MARSVWLMKRGVKRVIRFENHEVNKKIKEVEEKIKMLFELNEKRNLTNGNIPC